MKKTEALKLLNNKKNKLLKQYPYLGEWLQKYNGYLAGGVWLSALLNTPHKDLDIYFNSTENTEAFSKELNPKLWIIEGKSNIHIKQFELMRFVTYPTAMDCINDFDFSCCQIAWDGVTFYFGEYTLLDIESKYLRLLDIHAPLVPTLNRITKYINKGFKPDEHTFGTICKWIKQNGGADSVPMKFEAYEEEKPERLAEAPRVDVDIVRWLVEPEQNRAPLPRIFGWDNV